MKTKKEFAALCGMGTKKLAVYAKRSQVKYAEDGLIDANEPLNVAFLAKWSARNNVNKKLSTVPTDIDQALENFLSTDSGEAYDSETELAMVQFIMGNKMFKVLPLSFAKAIIVEVMAETLKSVINGLQIHLNPEQLNELNKIALKYYLSSIEVCENRLDESLNEILEDYSETN